MPQNITDASTYTATVTAPASADALDETEVLAMGQGLANRTKYLYDAVRPDYNYDSPVSVTVFVSPHEINPSFSSYGSPTTGLMTWYSNGFDLANSQVNDGVGYIPLDNHLPDDATLTAVRALVDPGAARSAGVNMELAVRRIDASSWPTAPSSTTLGTDTEDDTTTAAQSISIGAISEAIDKSASRHWVARLRAGNTGGTFATRDSFYGLELDITYPGPRAT